MLHLVSMIVVLATLLWSYHGAESNFPSLYRNAGNMLLYLKGFMQSDFLEWREYLKRLNWPFDDPSKFAGSSEEILAHTRIIRDRIKEKVLSFIQEYDETGLKLFIE